jgi:putative ABC transport system permease protein
MAFTVNGQIDFLRNRDFGFNQDRLLVIPNMNFLEAKAPFKNEVEQLSQVNISSYSNVVPGRNGSYELFKKLSDTDSDYVMLLINTDDNFIETFGIEITGGANFTEADLSKTEERYVLVSERAANTFGMEEPLGESIVALDDGRELQISGIIKEFDFNMSADEYTPMVIRPYSKYGEASSIRYLTINISTQNLISSVEEVKRIWEKQETGLPFQYYFYDQIFDQNFQSEKRLSGLLGIFSGMAVFIGLLGMMGLVSYSTEQLQKSIGIRKVFGASVAGILFLLTRDFIKLIIIAFAIAIPITNYFIKDWLKEFVYRMDIEPGLFIIPGIVIISVALLTIWGQSYRAAKANPIDSIRSE